MHFIIYPSIILSIYLSIYPSIFYLSIVYWEGGGRETETESLCACAYLICKVPGLWNNPLRSKVILITWQVPLQFWKYWLSVGNSAYSYEACAEMPVSGQAMIIPILRDPSLNKGTVTHELNMHAIPFAGNPLGSPRCQS